MYKPSEASQLLNIPESTLRRLANQFSEHLSPQTGRKRRYTERDISILSQAREMLERGLTVKLAREELLKVVELLEPEPLAPESEPDTSPVMRQLSVMSNQYSQLLRELEEARAEREQDRERLARLEEFLSRPWWVRLFRSPPKE